MFCWNQKCSANEYSTTFYETLKTNTTKYGKEIFCQNCGVSKVLHLQTKIAFSKSIVSTLTRQWYASLKLVEWLEKLRNSINRLQKINREFVFSLLYCAIKFILVAKKFFL